jgi:hypothetical protein
MSTTESKPDLRIARRAAPATVVARTMRATLALAAALGE